MTAIKKDERNENNVTKDTSSTNNQLTLLLAVVVDYLCTPEKKMSVKSEEMQIKLLCWIFRKGCNALLEIRILETKNEQWIVARSRRDCGFLHIPGGYQL